MMESFLFLLLSIEQTYLVVPMPLEAISIWSAPEKNDSGLISLSLDINRKIELEKGLSVTPSFILREHNSSDNSPVFIVYELK